MGEIGDKYSEELDREWVQLIREAKNLGIKKEEIRSFISNQRKKSTTIE